MCLKQQIIINFKKLALIFILKRILDVINFDFNQISWRDYPYFSVVYFYKFYQ